MTANQPPEDFPAIQGAIYGVALSLDSFLLNGIPIGVFRGDVFKGFLEKVARNLLRDLATLEEETRRPATADQAQVTEILAKLRTNCQQLIDLVAGLISFRTLPLEQLRARVSRIPCLRDACVQQLQELEACFRTPKPFYQSRPTDSTASVNGFLADLENLFTQE